MKILIVDDEPANTALLQYILLSAGYKDLRITADGREVCAIQREYEPDLILLDLMMPHLSGFEVMRQLHARLGPEECLPILVLTADVSVETKHQALEAGASDFVTKPFDHVEVLLRIKQLLHIRAQHQQLAQQKGTLEDTVAKRTGELRGALGQLEETLSQLRSTQQQVIQHERLSALGSMAAGLAHDFNNALSLILGYSELLQSDLRGTLYEAHSDEFLGTIITAAQDAAKMFNRLRGFYRAPDGDDKLGLIDVNVLVEQAAALTRPRWHGQALGDGVTISLQCELDRNLPELLADAAELREMLTNLIFNAVDAMPEGGTITLRTRLERGSPEDTLVLEVADTGMGMSDETRQRCLEPFFTTKGMRGTGLGLAMVYGTIQRHEGTIALHSAPGEGTRFEFRLPMRQPDAPEIVVPSADENATWRVLVVDDQADFLGVLRHYLTRDGHYVETAFDGHEALEKFHAAGAGGFDLIITDKAMPGMCGEQLAEGIKVVAPSTRIILLTGFGILADAATVDHPAIDLKLIKPVTHAVLRDAIGRVMAGYVPTSANGGRKRRRRMSDGAAEVEARLRIARRAA